MSKTSKKPSLSPFEKWWEANWTKFGDGHQNRAQVETKFRAIVREVWDEGKEEGREAGWSDGYNEGHDAGYQEAYDTFADGHGD